MHRNKSVYPQCNAIPNTVHDTKRWLGLFLLFPFKMFLDIYLSLFIIKCLLDGSRYKLCKTMSFIYISVTSAYTYLGSQWDTQCLSKQKSTTIDNGGGVNGGVTKVTIDIKTVNDGIDLDWFGFILLYLCVFWFLVVWKIKNGTFFLSSFTRQRGHVRTVCVKGLSVWKPELCVTSVMLKNEK